MKVAIIGAGMSGLACAFELEKAGIQPTIFEKRSHVGEALSFTCLCSRLVTRVREDMVKYFNKNYALDIRPISSLNEAIMMSPNKKTVAKGNLGYIFKRGMEDYSIENQLASKIKSPIFFNSDVDIKDIKKKYDHVVVATASPAIPRKLRVWKDNFISQARIATILGDFKINSASIWFNEKYSGKAFCYMVPNSSKEATLTLIIDNQSSEGLDYYWHKFLLNEEMNHTIIQHYDTEYYCGFVNPLKIGNVYFVGNAAGLTDSFIGVGTFNAIESGILAGRAIAKGLDYRVLAKPISVDVMKLYEFRKAINTFENKGFDKVIGFIGLPAIKQFIYNNPLLKIQSGVALAKLYNQYKAK